MIGVPEACADSDPPHQRPHAVAVLHDLNLACRYADYLVAMKTGKLVAEGRPAEVMTEAVVADVFGMASRVVIDPISDTPMIVPIGRHRLGQGVGSVGHNIVPVPIQ